LSSVFLWGLKGKPPRVDNFNPRQNSWWNQYSQRLKMSPTAKAELLRSSREIVALLPDPQNWGSRPLPYRGLVVGGVQSGKTASMIGVTAIALDQGYRVVVVLSGSKDDLRRQTARRFNTQLMLQSDEIPGTSGARTLSKEEEKLRLPGFCLPYFLDAHQFRHLHLRLQSALRDDTPAVLVIKKHTTSLADVRSKLEIAYSRLGIERVPLLVLDDECDDASVDLEDMTVPTAISGLWRRDADHPLVAYIGYTATAAANLLQKTGNELFPSAFAYLLRSPADSASLTTFQEPAANNWYTGGATYYEAFGDEPGIDSNFLISDAVEASHLAMKPEHNPSLLDAVRAYFVSGAYRLATTGGLSFDNPATMMPHSMLVQTSSSIQDHQTWLEGMRLLFDGAYTADRSVRWNPEAVLRSLDKEEDLWRSWYNDFTKSRDRLQEERPRAWDSAFVTWRQVKDQIGIVAEHVRLRAVNSDETIGSDLDFVPRLSLSGTLLPPRDLFVIAIGGSKLSRGITIEGLSISYFTRWNPNPTEDTVLQLSRWYGYRGQHLEFCRLFTTTRIYDEVRQMHLNDTDLRHQLSTLMLAHKSPEDAALVLSANPHALPTAKLGEGKLRDLSYSPFATVFRRIEITNDTLAAQNEAAALQLVSMIKERAPQQVRSASGARRGLLSRGWTAVEVAESLDRLAFIDHNPSSTANPARSYYRRPDTTRPLCAGRSIEDDPYQVAAYLRQWAAEGSPPCFNVGVAYGEMNRDEAPFDFPLTNRAISDTGIVSGGWSGRRAGWRGDAFFDDPQVSVVIVGTSQRTKSAEGLLLLYVIHRSARGRAGTGSARNHHSPMLGIVIPDGGPTWRRITVDRRKLISD
jgi:hypothetical protein